MTAILSRADLLEQCEHWISPNIPENVDGRIWKEFMAYKVRAFLANKHNIGLMLNCDWFQPFKHANYGEAVLYLVILNLPRSLRFKPENEGPSETSYSEMNSLWSEGFTLVKGVERIVMHAALLATVCDIPETAKIGGCVAYTSKHAC